MNMAQFFIACIITGIMSVTCICREVKADSRPNEHQVKAAMLFNMIKFVDWPTDALAGDNGTITVCVLGRGGFVTALDALQGERLRGRSISIRHISQPQEASGCQVLAVGDVDRRTVAAIVERTRQQALLTISDMPNFAQAGGVVGFMEQEGKMRFVVNTSAAQQHRIRINSQLLRIARIVQDPP